MGVFLLAFSWSCPPPGPLVFLVLVCAFLALCSVLVFSWFLSCCGSSVGVFLFVFLPAILRLSSLWPLCAAFGVAGVSLFAVFVVLWGWLPPPLAVLSPPLRLFPCDVLVQSLCWSLPLFIWLLHATARLPCSFAWGVVVLCFLASSCFMAAKAFGPVWGFVLPSTPWCWCCCCALCSCAEVFILDDPGPPLDAAKPHTRHSLQQVWHTLLLSSSAFPAPSLPPSCLVVWMCLSMVGAFPSPCAIPSTFT